MQDELNRFIANFAANMETVSISFYKSLLDTVDERNKTSVLRVFKRRKLQHDAEIYTAMTSIFDLLKTSCISSLSNAQQDKTNKRGSLH